MEGATRIAWITVAPVKGLALVARTEVTLERHGVTEDRRLHLIDERGRLVNGKLLGAIVHVVADLDVAAGRLRLRFPDGSEVAGSIDLAEAVTTSFYGRPVAGRLVAGAFAEALSTFSGTQLRLVWPDGDGDGLDRGPAGAVTMLGTGSLRRLAELAGVEAVDHRRFRMLFGVEGVDPHEEDSWIGREVALGDAVIGVTGNVGRCMVTTRNPDSGVADLDTLRLLAGYRGVVETTEPLPFGVVGRVVSGGRVRVGDMVCVRDEA